MKRSLALLAGSALAVTACGSGSDEADPVVDDSLLDAEQLLEDAEAQGVSALSLAFDQTASASAYRAELAMGMSMDMGALGQTIEFDADPATPMVFVEVDADGEQYTLVELAPMMNSILAGAGLGDDIDATSMMGGDLSMETWLVGDTLTMDVGGFGTLLEQNLGNASPFPAEVFTVDISRLANGLSGPQVASTLAGQAAPDPVEMATVLREVLGESATVDESGERFSGTIGFFDYARAFGQDPTSMLGGMDGSLEQMSGGDVDALLAVFDEIAVDVEVTLGNGAVDTIRFDIDLTPMFAALPEIVAASGEPVSDAEVSQMEAMLGDAQFEMTMLMDYDLDASVDVVIPTGDFPDATDEFLGIFDTATGN